MRKYRVPCNKILISVLFYSKTMIKLLDNIKVQAENWLMRLHMSFHGSETGFGFTISASPRVSPESDHFFCQRSSMFDTNWTNFNCKYV